MQKGEEKAVVFPDWLGPTRRVSSSSQALARLLMGCSYLTVVLVENAPLVFFLNTEDCKSSQQIFCNEMNAFLL